MVWNFGIIGRVFSEGFEMEYNSFIAKYSNFPKDLCELYCLCGSSLPKSLESHLYNKGTMERDADNPVSPNIVLANAKSFKVAEKRYEVGNPNMDDVERRARVVFDFLQKHGQVFSYEKNADDVLFGDVKRKDFYGFGEQSVYGEIVGNTNFKDRHIGSMQIICLPEVKNEMPRGGDELAGFVKASGISHDEWEEVMLKRGLYHESVHAALGTTDERKCDVFALLKIMKEHPKHSKLIYDVYNCCRSKIGHSVKMINESRYDVKGLERKIKNGTMTYIMPQTYSELGKYAQNPSLIPQKDSDILKLTYDITAKPDFTDEQLKNFFNVVCKDKVSKVDFANLDVVKKCMMQGHCLDVDEYIAKDKTLASFMDKKGVDMEKKVPLLQGVKSIDRRVKEL